MSYIINPAWFYWISVMDGVKTALFVASVLLIVPVIVLMIVACVDYLDGDLKMARATKKPIIICSIISFVLAITVILLPSKNTLIEMQIAKFATHENTEWTLDAIKSAVDYIVSSINAIK